MICIDASIIIRSLVDPHALQVNQQWQQWHDQGETFVAPALLLYEVTNGLYKYQKAGIYSKTMVAEQQSAAFALPIQLIGTETIHKRALELALAWSLPATYDAHYIAVAEQFDCTLWTGDAKLVKRVQPHINYIHLLR